MAIRKNMRHMGAATRTKRHHEDREQARYQRKQAEAWGPWLCQRTRGLAPLELGHEVHTKPPLWHRQITAPGEGLGVGALVCKIRVL